MSKTLTKKIEETLSNLFPKAHKSTLVNASLSAIKKLVEKNIKVIKNGFRTLDLIPSQLRNVAEAERSYQNLFKRYEAKLRILESVFDTQDAREVLSGVKDKMNDLKTNYNNQIKEIESAPLSPNDLKEKIKILSYKFFEDSKKYIEESWRDIEDFWDSYSKATRSLLDFIQRIVSSLKTSSHMHNVLKLNMEDIERKLAELESLIINNNGDEIITGAKLSLIEEKKRKLKHDLRMYLRNKLTEDEINLLNCLNELAKERGTTWFSIEEVVEYIEYKFNWRREKVTRLIDELRKKDILKTGISLPF